jgi:DDE superfamily endonuclease
VNARRLELLPAGPATAPHGGGVLVIDDSGDRKDGTATAHVGRQWLGRYGKTDNGVVTVTTVRADERIYYPVDAVPYTPARHFAKGKSDPAFRTKLAIGADLAVRARMAGFTFRAVAADSAYGDQDGFRGELAEAGLPFVMALRPRHGIWARAEDAHTPVDAARALAWGGPDDPGDWQAVTRRFRDGHAGTWYAADARLGAWGPDGARRLVACGEDRRRPGAVEEGTIPEGHRYHHRARPGHDRPGPPARRPEGLRHEPARLEHGRCRGYRCLPRPLEGGAVVPHDQGATCGPGRCSTISVRPSRPTWPSCSLPWPWPATCRTPLAPASRRSSRPCARHAQRPLRSTASASPSPRSHRRRPRHPQAARIRSLSDWRESGQAPRSRRARECPAQDVEDSP